MTVCIEIQRFVTSGTSSSPEFASRRPRPTYLPRLKVKPLNIHHLAYQDPTACATLLAISNSSILLIFKWNTSGASACDQLILGWGAMSLKGFQKAAVRVRTDSEYLRLMRSGSTVLIPPPLPGTPNLQAEIQYRAYFQISHTQHNVSFRLTVGQQGEHTKDAVYIDSERRFQELEKACLAQRSTASRALMEICEHRRRRNYMKNQRSKSIQLQVYIE